MILLTVAVVQYVYASIQGDICYVDIYAISSYLSLKFSTPLHPSLLFWEFHLHQPPKLFTQTGNLCLCKWSYYKWKSWWSYYEGIDNEWIIRINEYNLSAKVIHLQHLDLLERSWVESINHLPTGNKAAWSSIMWWQRSVLSMGSIIEFLFLSHTNSFTVYVNFNFVLRIVGRDATLKQWEIEIMIKIKTLRHINCRNVHWINNN